MFMQFKIPQLHRLDQRIFCKKPYFNYMLTQKRNKSDILVLGWNLLTGFCSIQFSYSLYSNWCICFLHLLYKTTHCTFSFVLFCTEGTLTQYAEKSIVHTEQTWISFPSHMKVIDFKGRCLCFILC